MISLWLFHIVLDFTYSEIPFSIIPFKLRELSCNQVTLLFSFFFLLLFSFFFFHLFLFIIIFSSFFFSSATVDATSEWAKSGSPDIIWNWYFIFHAIPNYEKAPNITLPVQRKTKDSIGESYYRLFLLKDNFKWKALYSWEHTISRASQ